VPIPVGRVRPSSRAVSTAVKARVAALGGAPHGVFGPLDYAADPPGVRSLVPGPQADQSWSCPGGEQQCRSRWQCADVGGFEDFLAAQGDLLAGAAVAVAGRAHGDVVVADEGGQESISAASRGGSTEPVRAAAALSAAQPRNARTAGSRRFP